MSEYTFKFANDNVFMVSKTSYGVVWNMLYSNRVQKLSSNTTRNDIDSQKEFIRESISEITYPEITNEVIHCLLEKISLHLLLGEKITFLDGQKDFFIDEDQNLLVITGKRSRKVELPDPRAFNRDLFKLNNIVFYN